MSFLRARHSLYLQCAARVAILCALVFLPKSAARALEPPRAGEIAGYRTGGTFAARLTSATGTGNHVVQNANLTKWRSGGSMMFRRVCVLPIDFSDAPASGANPSQPTLQSRFFGTGGAQPYDSLRNFYRRSSNYRLYLDGTVLPWYRAASPRSTYAGANQNQIDRAKAEQLIMEALNWHASAAGGSQNFTSYDGDNDGTIDALVVVWAGGDTGWGGQWWGWTSAWGTTPNPTFLISGKKVGSYIWTGETVTGDPSPPNFSPKAVIHEMGHVLGLPDLYDYDSAAGLQGGAGGLDIMDAEGDHNCFSKWLLGWVSPTVVSGIRQNGTFTLRPAADYTDAVAVMKGLDGANNKSEYFMVQNRYPTGNDTNIPASGLLIWHVDARVDINGNFLYNNQTGARKLLRLMEADGLEQIDTGLQIDSGDFYNPGSDFGPATTPNSLDYQGVDGNVIVNSITTLPSQGRSCFVSAGWGPDLEVRNAGTPPYDGALVYQQTPSAPQVKSQDVCIGQTANYEVRVTNRDPSSTFTFYLRSDDGSSGGWTVGFRRGGSDITSSVVGSGHPLTLGPMASDIILISAVPDGTVTDGEIKSVGLEAFMDGTDVTVRDVNAVETRLQKLDQPDLLVKRSVDADGLYASRNIYQQTPAGAQISNQVIRSGDTAVFNVKVVSDGTAAGSFRLRAVEVAAPGWTTVYKKADGTDITLQVLAGTFSTASLAVGAEEAFTIEMTATPSAVGAVPMVSTLSAYRAGTPSLVSDCIRVIADVDQPDLLVKLPAEPDTAYAINNVYQSVPAGAQARTVTTDCNVFAGYSITVQNDSVGAHALVVKATESAEAGWAVIYRKADGTDISALVRGGGYTTASLAAGGSEVLTVAVKATSAVPPNTSKTVTVTSHMDAADAAIRDAVQLGTVVRDTIQPDLLIKKASEPDTAFATADLYQSMPSGDQIEPQLLRLTGKTVSHLRLVNNGNQPRAYVLKGVDGRTPGWLVTVLRADGTNITQAVRSVGYTADVLAPGAGETFTVEMSPDTTAAPVQAQTFTLSAYINGSDPTPADAVQVSSSVDRADLLIRLGSETDSSLGLDNTYQVDPAGLQLRTQSVDMNAAGVYRIKVENDAVSSQVLVVKASESAEAGWNIVYKKADGSDITSQVRGTGYSTANLASGGSEVLTVEVTPGNAVPGGTSKTATVRVYHVGDPNTPGDAVQMVTTVKSLVQPDLLVKQASEPDTAYATANIYQQTPSGGQVKRVETQTGAAAIYHVRVTNAGNMPRSFVVRAAEDNAAGWTVVCKKADGADITREVKQTGYPTGTLAAAGSETLTFEVTPDTSVTGGETKAVTVSLFAGLGDTKVEDAVRCVSALAVITQPDLALRTGTDPAAPFAGDAVYEAAPTGDQVASTSLAALGTATYQVKITNRGNTTRPFVLRASESTETGWTITYRSVGAEVGDALRGPGFAVPAVAPGGTATVDVTLVPAATVPGSTSKSVLFTISLDGADTLARDAVKVIATVNANDQADLQVKLEAEPDAAYATPGLHQTTPNADQTKNQAVLPNGMAIYYVKVANDGNTERTFVVKATETAGPGWQLSYRYGATDIGDAVRGAGYVTPKMGRNESRVLTIGIAPDGTAAGSASTILSVSADGTTTDSVQAAAMLNHVPELPELLAPAEGAVVLPAPTFSFRAVDPDADSLTYQVVVKPAAGGREILFNGGTGLSGADVTFTVPEAQALTAGPWTWQVRATDSRGAASVLTPARTFVANRPPAIPTAFAPAPGDVALPLVVFRGQTTDPDGDMVRLVVETTFGGRTQTITSDVAAAGTAMTVQPASGSGLSTGTGTWRLKAVDNRGAESGWSEAFPLTVLAATPQAMSMAGLTTFGLPARAGSALPADFGLLGAQILAFDQATQKFVPASTIQLGQGYFVRSDAALPVRFSGTALSESFAVPLKAGWNLISPPFATPVTWDMEALWVRAGGVEKTLASAVATGWISDYVWGWRPDPANAGTGYYELLYDSWMLSGMNDQLEPWRAYWVHAAAECELVLPIPGRRRSASRADDTAKRGWSLRLQGASAGGNGAVVVGIAGAAARGMTVGLPPELPMGGAGIRFSLESPGGPAALDLRARGDGRQVWNLVVEPSRAARDGDEVTLTWPDLRALPKDVSLTLTDPATGARRSLRTSGGYTFRLGGGARRLQIAAEPRANVPVLVTGVDVAPLRSDSRAVRFTLSRAAAVDVEILSPTGRSVGMVTRSYTGATGMNQVIWSGPAAPGLYLVRVTATSEEGIRAQAMRLAVIAR